MRSGLDSIEEHYQPIPFAESDDTYYSVFISGKTIDDISNGSLIMTGPGFTMGVNDIQLEPDEFLELVISPDGDYIAFRSQAAETTYAPPTFVSFDPVSDQDPSIIFTIDGVVLDPNEESAITLDPDLERVYFDDTGALGQEFDVTMTFIWPDGDQQDYLQTLFVPPGSTSAFIDFGAWDGLGEPSYYVDLVLQNPLANHRLKLISSTGSYDPTPQPNAPGGVYHVQATFQNVTEIVLNDVYFTVADLGAGNVVLNAYNGPDGVGAEVLVPATALGSNGLLDANESFTFNFDVGLATAGDSELTVDANGEPWDWTPDVDPPPAYDANDESFVFAVTADSQPGDCNMDVTVDAGDISAVVMEIFDGDGLDAGAASGGTFSGGPTCDANEDTIINAADLSCTVLLIFNGPNACSALTNATTQPAAQLTIRDKYVDLSEEAATVEIALASNGNLVSAVAFVVAYDATHLHFDTSDDDGDGRPDAIALPATLERTLVSVTDRGGELAIALANVSATPTSFVDEKLLSITFSVNRSVGGEAVTSELSFSSDEVASLGSVDGAVVSVVTQDGTLTTTPIEIISQLYLPLLSSAD